MTDFIIKKLPYDLSSNAGTALVGQCLLHREISARLDRRFAVGVGAPASSENVKNYHGLLVQGKSDFDAIEPFRKHTFFKRSPGISIAPSSPTLRQRMNTHAQSWCDLAGGLNEALVSPKGAGMTVDFGALPCGCTPADWDTFVMNNSNSKKE